MGARVHFTVCCTKLARPPWRARPCESRGVRTQWRARSQWTHRRRNRLFIIDFDALAPRRVPRYRTRALRKKLRLHIGHRRRDTCVVRGLKMSGLGALGPSGPDFHRRVTARTAPATATRFRFSMTRARPARGERVKHMDPADPQLLHSGCGDICAAHTRVWNAAAQDSDLWRCAADRRVVCWMDPAAAARRPAAAQQAGVWRKASDTSAPSRPCTSSGAPR